jgi:glutamyl-Q tRNA(Asp) synthetase
MTHSDDHHHNHECGDDCAVNHGQDQTQTQAPQKRITRFAPSPSGLLHLGNLYSAYLCLEHAKDHDGLCFLRIEDIDTQRSKNEFEQAIIEDLQWMGLNFDMPEGQGPYFKQSNRTEIYEKYINNLWERDLAYPCFASRKEIQSHIDALPKEEQEALKGPEGYRYPGIYRDMPYEEAKKRIDAGEPYAIRLDIRAVMEALEDRPTWHDAVKGTQIATPEIFGDVILSARDYKGSYHASCVIDDALQGVNHVIRGVDLFQATHIHVVLQLLWGFAVPSYFHHPLLLDEAREKPMSKRYNALSIQSLREDGKTPQDVLLMLSKLSKTNDMNAKNMSGDVVKQNIPQHDVHSSVVLKTKTYDMRDFVSPCEEDGEDAHAPKTLQ